ncbi:MAG TPA: alpha/beta hydrolase [Polyangia bacterium]|jgi:pimeloyl-ACP methyl ester carboxylesterase
MRRALSRAALAVAAASCAGTKHDVRPDEAPVPARAAQPAAPAGLEGPAAPLDRELAGLPDARAVWLVDAELGPIYVVTAGAAAARDPAAPPLVLVHGLGPNGMRDFYPVLAPLAARRRVVLLDLPGFGRSARANARYAPDLYAAVLARVIATLAPAGPVDVVGHSMGGAIALYHAAAYPAQVRRLIVVDAAGILHRDAWFAHHVRRVTDPAHAVLPRVADLLGEAADLVSETSRILDPAPEIVLELAPLRQKLLGGRPERIAALGLILQDYGPLIARVRAPTLIVWGADDVVAPLRTGLMLADRLPDARLVVLPGVGHRVMAEAPGLLVPEIERHLAGPDAPAGRAPAPVAAGASQGKAVCQGQPDVQLSGVYDSVVIEDCARVTLDRVRTTSLVIRRSTASVVRSSFSAGIVADASTLIITGGEIAGPIALDVKDSKLDLAGVAIAPGREAFRTAGSCRLLLSVCPVRTPDGRVAYRHGFVSAPTSAAAAHP